MVSVEGTGIHWERFVWRWEMILATWTGMDAACEVVPWVFSSAALRMSMPLCCMHGADTCCPMQSERGQESSLSHSVSTKVWHTLRVPEISLCHAHNINTGICPVYDCIPSRQPLLNPCWVFWCLLFLFPGIFCCL